MLVVQFKFSVKLADQTFRAELFPLPASPSGSERTSQPARPPSILTWILTNNRCLIPITQATFCSDLGKLVSQPSSSRPRIVLSTKPLDVTASESIYLLQKTSQRDVYDQHQSLGGTLRSHSAFSLLTWASWLTPMRS